MSLGKRIQLLRMGRGLSQAALADALDVAQSSVADWELGTHSPRYGKLKAIAKALRVSVSKLVGAA